MASSPSCQGRSRNASARTTRSTPGMHPRDSSDSSARGTRLRVMWMASSRPSRARRREGRVPSGP
ncbi:hypothetical protein ACFPRL_24780 [Pseudoclavibacter helvolus]